MMKIMNNSILGVVDAVQDVDIIESIVDGQIANMVKDVVQTAVADGIASDTVSQVATAYLDDFELLTLHIWERHIVSSVQYDRMISHFIEVWNALAYTYVQLPKLDDGDDEVMHWTMW